MKFSEIKKNSRSAITAKWEFIDLVVSTTLREPQGPPFESLRGHPSRASGATLREPQGPPFECTSTSSVTTQGPLNHRKNYFARYSLIPAAALRPSPIGICRFASKLEFATQTRPLRANAFLFCKILINTSSSLTSFAHR